MLILLFIFAVFYGSFVYISTNTNERCIEDLLDNVINRIDHSNNSNVDYVYCEDFDGKIYEENNLEIYENKFFRDIYDNIKNTDKIKSYFNHKDDFYYKLSIEKNGHFHKKTFVVIDMTSSNKLVKQNNINTIAILSTIYVVLFVVVYTLSFRVFEPLKQTLEKQKRLVSNASHELKTPLTIIKANTAVLSSEENNKWLNNISEQTKRLELLINDMLSLAKSDEQKIILSKETFNLSSVAYETLLPFDEVAFESKKRIIYNICDNIFMTGDVTSIKKIMMILIDNSIKYALKHSDIEVNLVKEKNYIKFSVKNAGSSIKEENSNKVFERFYRGSNSRNRDSGGSGLGLSIAKSIADYNNWKIFANSHYGISMEICLIIKTTKQDKKQK